MGNFIGLVYGTLKEKGIDTSKMSREEAIAKFNELKNEDGNEKKASKEIKDVNVEKQKRISELEEKIKNTSGIFTKIKLRYEIDALKEGFETVEEYKNAKEKERVEAQEKLLKKREKQAEQTKSEQQPKKEPVEIKNREHKEKQLEIIQKYNPMRDDYHTGIRKIEDIKTFEETLSDEDSFVWGDFSREDAERAVKTNSITIYSSYPIKQGTFVSTSKRQAEEYAGGQGKKVYSKTISLDKVAWISGDEGQFAEV